MMIQSLFSLEKNRLSGAEYSVVQMNSDRVEVSFKNTYDPAAEGIKLPLTVDTRSMILSYQVLTLFLCFLKVPY